MWYKNSRHQKIYFAASIINYYMFHSLINFLFALLFAMVLLVRCSVWHQLIDFSFIFITTWFHYLITISNIAQQLLVLNWKYSLEYLIYCVQVHPCEVCISDEYILIKSFRLLDTKTNQKCVVRIWEEKYVMKLSWWSKNGSEELVFNSS